MSCFLKKKDKKPVFCKGCTYLAVIQLADEASPTALCLASAKFVSGPFRNDVDITGTESAAYRNCSNNCSFKKRVSFKSRKLKKWILKSGKGLVFFKSLKSIDHSEEKRLVDEINRRKIELHKQQLMKQQQVQTIKEVKRQKETFNNEQQSREKSHKKKTSSKREETKEESKKSIRIRSKQLKDLTPTRLSNEEFFSRLVAGSLPG